MPTTIGRNDMKLTRREFGSMTLASLGLALPRTSRGAAASMPAGAIDCHNHVVGPQAKYPMAANRTYTPPEASVAQLKALRLEVRADHSMIRGARRGAIKLGFRTLNSNLIGRSEFMEMTLMPQRAASRLGAEAARRPTHRLGHPTTSSPKSKASTIL